jgi:hypothetical protein
MKNRNSMEEKLNIEQNGRETTIKATDDIKEITMTFGQYRVETLKIIFKD